MVILVAESHEWGDEHNVVPSFYWSNPRSKFICLIDFSYLFYNLLIVSFTFSIQCDVQKRRVFLWQRMSHKVLPMRWHGTLHRWDRWSQLQYVIFYIWQWNGEVWHEGKMELNFVMLFYYSQPMQKRRVPMHKQKLCK